MVMSPQIIRQKLREYVEAATDDKLQALYTILQKEVDEIVPDYSEGFVSELDRRYNAYMADKSTAISSTESKVRIQAIMNKARENEA